MAKDLPIPYLSPEQYRNAWPGIKETVGNALDSTPINYLISPIDRATEAGALEQEVSQQTRTKIRAQEEELNARKELTPEAREILKEKAVKDQWSAGEDAIAKEKLKRAGTEYSNAMTDIMNNVKDENERKALGLELAKRSAIKHGVPIRDVMSYQVGADTVDSITEATTTKKPSEVLGQSTTESEKTRVKGAIGTDSAGKGMWGVVGEARNSNTAMSTTGGMKLAKEFDTEIKSEVDKYTKPTDLQNDITSAVRENKERNAIKLGTLPLTQEALDRGNEQDKLLGSTGPSGINANFSTPNTPPPPGTVPGSLPGSRVPGVLGMASQGAPVTPIEAVQTPFNTDARLATLTQLAWEQNKKLIPAGKEDDPQLIKQAYLDAKNKAEQQVIIEQKALDGKARATEEGKYLEQKQNVLQKQQQDMISRENERREIINSRVKDIDNLTDDIRNQKVGWWEGTGTKKAGNAVMLLGAVLMEVAGARTVGGRAAGNQGRGFATLMGFIDRDLEEQKTQLSSKSYALQAKKNNLDAIRDIFSDEKAADSVFRVAQLDALGVELEKIGARTKNDAAKQNIAELQAGLNQARAGEYQKAIQYEDKKLAEQQTRLIDATYKASQLDIDRERLRMDKQKQGEDTRVPDLEFTGLRAPTQKDTQDVIKVKNESEKFFKTLDDAEAFVNSEGRAFPGTDASKQGKRLSRQLQLQAKNEALFSLGVLSGPDLGILDTVIPDDLSKMRQDDVRNSLATMRKMITDGYNSAIANRGYKDKRTYVAPKTKIPGER